MELQEIHAVDFGLFEKLDLKLNDLGLVCVIGNNKDSDAASSNGCLSGDTLIDCPRDLTKWPRGIPIRELVGQTPHVYTWDGQQIRVGQASSVHLTKKDAPCVRVKLTKYATANGAGQGGKWLPPQELVGTADHPVLLSDGVTWKPLGDLKPGDSLCSMYRRESGGWRSLIYWTGLASKKAVSEQQFVCENLYGKRPDGHDAHHKDDNGYNHTPSNMEWKDGHTHKSEHTSARNKLGLAGWQATGVHPRGMLGKKRSEEFKERTRAQAIAMGKDPEIRARKSESLKRSWDDPEKRAKHTQRMKDYWEKNREAIKSSRAAKRAAKVNHTVVGVEDAGLQDVYDITVPGYENFVANGVVVHNSGKSTIIKALAWGLYGESIDGYDGDAVIRNGCASATVSIKGEHDGASVMIVRQRFKGSPRLALIIGDNPWSTAKAEVQQRINQMMGMDFDTFRNTVMYGQGDRGRFVDPKATDAQRKALLSSILKIDNMPECAALARNKVATLKAAIDTAKAEIANSENEIIELEELDYEAQISEWEAKRRERALEARNHAKSELEKSKSVLADSTKRLAEYKAYLKRLESRETYEQACERFKLAEEAHAEAKENVSKLASDRADFIKEISELTAAIVDADHCPVCNSDIRKGAAKLHFDEMKHRKSMLSGGLEKLDQVTIPEARLVLNKAVVAYNDAIEKQRQASDLFGEIRMVKANIENELRNTKEKSDALARSAARWAAQARGILAEDNPHKAEGDRIEKKLISLRERIDKLTLACADNSKQMAVAQFWAKGFGTQGLPSFMLDAIMPYLTERANHYLGILADGDITMCFATQRELKSAKGAMRDEISITWEVEGVSAYPPSGGQLKKMEIATDLALMDLVATREGGHPDMLFMDEILDGLDEEGKSRVTKLLHELRKARGSIFVISHDDGISESFDQTIKVTKMGGVSVAQVIK